jgi:hypothetical protein
LPDTICDALVIGCVLHIARFTYFSNLATGLGQFHVGFDQNRGIGCGIYIIAKPFSKIFNDGLNFLMLADQRGASLGRSPKHKTAKSFPIAKYVQSFGLHHKFQIDWFASVDADPLVATAQLGWQDVIPAQCIVLFLL